ncbi:MAG: TIGR02996 domain-containing protein [Kofleriaceae bacterium]
MARKHKPPEYVRHTGGDAWGVGVLVAKTSEQRTYLFEDGVRRAFKQAFCERFIVPAPPPSEEVIARLMRGSQSGGIATPKAIHLELEAEIRAQPDELGPYLVYADWLMSRGDPRGELITLQHRCSQDPDDKRLHAAEAAFLDTHRNYLYPPALDELLRLPRTRGDAQTHCEATWRLGFLDRIRIARGKPTRVRTKELDVEGLVRELVGHPSAAFLRSIVFGQLGTAEQTNYIHAVSALVTHPLPALRELTLGDFRATLALERTRAGNLSPVLSAAPMLERLTVRAGSLRFSSAIHHDRLRQLGLIMAELSAGLISKVFGATLPALEKLEVSCPHLAPSSAELVPLLEATQLPSLRHLIIRQTSGTGALLQRILESPLVAQLHSLTLDHGDLSDGDVVVVTNSRAAQRACLRHLGVDDNPLSSEAALELKRWCQRASHSAGESPNDRGL